MGCKVLCPSFALLAYLMICEHVRAQCTQSSFGPRNVIVTADYLLTQSFADGVTVTIQCMVGYKPVDSKASKSVTCKGTQWANLDFSCTKKSCGALPDILHGRYEMSGNLFGDTAKPVCDTGYVLAGQEVTRICRDQGWDGRDYICEPVTCPAPQPIENGQLADVPLDYYDYSQAVSYRCNAGFSLIGQSTIHCSEDGTFKPNPPTCFDGCPAPRIPNAERIGGKSPPYKMGNFIDFKCGNGYTMKGDYHIVCKENGWSPEPPLCIGPCNSPVLNEHVTLTQEFLSQKSFPHGSKVTVECIHGYKSNDSVMPQSITCEETKWSKLLLTCVALPTTTTATTLATSTTRTTSKAVPKNNGDAAGERPGMSKGTVIGIIVAAVVGGGGVASAAGIFIHRSLKRSKDEYSDKTDSNKLEVL